MVKAKRIFCVVAYDISDDKRRAKVVKVLEKYGVRVNYSVFECLFTEVQYKKVQLALENQVYKREDTIIFYPICVNCFSKIVYKPVQTKSVKTVEVL